MVTLSGQSSNTRDVTWEVDRVPIAATSDAGEATGPETWGPDLSVIYLPPVVPRVPPAPPVSPVPPGPPGPPGTPAPPMRSTVPPVMTPVMSPVPPMVPPPPGVMPPSSPAGIDNPQVDEGRPDNEILQPGQTRAAPRAYRATASARLPDHALFNQRTPALPTCDASQLSKPSTYDEAMHSPYRANWSHAIEGEISGLEEAGTFKDT